MELEKLRKDIGEEIKIDVGYLSTTNQPIDSFIEWLQGVKQQGATHIDFDYNGNNEAMYEIILQAFEEYLETTEQAKERIEADNAICRAKKEAEFNMAKDTYERLKEEFDNS